MLNLIKQLLGINTMLKAKIHSIELYNAASDFYALKDYEQAFPLMLQSAQQGYEVSMCTLGSMYLNGLGVPENGKEAERWLVASVEAGYVPAESILGMAYVTGKAGHRRDIKCGRALLTKAAKEGDQQAAEMLELMAKRVGLFKNLKG